MKRVTLAEVADVFNGKTPSKAEQRATGHPVLKVKDLSALGEFRGAFDSYVDDGFAEKYRAKWARQGDTVILNAAHSASHVASKAALLRADVEGSLLTGEWLVVRPRRGVDARFVHYWLTGPLVRSRLKDSVKGIHLYPRDVAALKIPLPSLDEQRRIAAMLDQADTIRAKRRQVLAQLDALTQSIFRDMFGDLAVVRWDRVPLGDLVFKIDSGTSPVCEARPADDDEWGILKLGAVTYGVFQPAENKAFLGDVGAMVANEVQPGDVLITRKNTRELVGAVAVVDEVRPRLLLPDLIFRLHMDRARIEPRFFQALMMNERKRLAVRNLSSGSAASMPNISKGRLVGLPIELPPVEHQREFSRRVGAASTVHAVAGTDSLDDLFATLQARAFRGQL